jgi:hydroxymethylbilane synthase
LRPLRIGTRGSVLARWQAEFIRKQLFQLTGVEAELVIIKTSGDKLQASPLTQIGGKGIFIKELEDALMEETVDLAVHSVKDIPTDTPSRLSFPAVCRRDDVHDCLISNSGATLANLKPNARVGTGSLRRQAQLRRHRPDLDLRDLRGNVDTRLRKVESGEYDAIILAKAGLDRLGWSHKITEVFSPEISLPAVGQGAIAVQSRAKDVEIGEILGKLDDAETRRAIIAERALLAALQGGCQLPLGAWARVERGELVMDAVVCSLDGAQYIRERGIGPGEATPDQATELGQSVARRLVENGAMNILDEVNRSRA